MWALFINCLSLIAFMEAKSIGVPSDPSSATPVRAVDKQHPITAFDCDRPLHIRDVDYEIPQECEPKNQVQVGQPTKFSVGHLEEFKRVPAHVCTVTYTQTVSYCGTADHSTPVLKADHTFADRSFTIIGATCSMLVRTGRTLYGDFMRLQGDDVVDVNTAYPLMIPGTTTINVRVVGETQVLNGHVHCVGHKWTNTLEPGGELVDNAIVYRTWRVRIEEDELRIPISDGPLILNEKLLQLPEPCLPLSGSCLMIDSVAVWDREDVMEWCPIAKGIEFEGVAAKDSNNNTVVMSTDGQLVRFVLGSQRPYCGSLLFSTNYENVFLTKGSLDEKMNRPLHPSEVDLHSFIVNRDDRLYSDLTGHVTAEFNALLAHDCATRHKNQRIFSWLSGVDSGLVPWRYRNGTFALARGESLYLFECPPVTVYPTIPEDPSTCYQDLPVYVPGNISGAYKYLERHSHQLTDVGVQIPCDSKFLPKYKDDNGIWFTATGTQIVATAAPGEQPPITPAWDSEDHLKPVDWSTGGIYSGAQVKSLQKYLDFGRARKALQNRLAMQHDPSQEGPGYITPMSVFPRPRGWALIANGGILGGFFRFLRSWSEFTSFILSFWVSFKIMTFTLSLTYKIKLLRPIYGFFTGLFWALVPDILLLRQLHQRSRGDSSPEDPQPTAPENSRDIVPASQSSYSRSPWHHDLLQPQTNDQASASNQVPPQNQEIHFSSRWRTLDPV